MSGLDANPFADPQAVNPFEDPAVRQASRSNPAAVGEYNPFESGASRPQPQVAAPQPAVVQTTQEVAPPAYTRSAAQEATSDLQQRQDELEQKAAELERREEALHRTTKRVNNFPPLPEKCCVQPCFYQDVAVDIPVEFQKIVKISYFMWIAYVGLLLVNMVGALAYFIVSPSTSNHSGVTFGVSILYIVVFTPCSFVCWFRPVYNAFRSDSSFNFFVFFFIFFFQFIVTCLLALGVDSYGTCGFINSITLATSGGASHVIVGCLMIAIAIAFALTALTQFLLLIKIHRIYRSTGASFQKAQQEFAQGVMSNKTVQTTATSVATTAAKSAVDSSLGNRY